jgi:hypothetical protein
MIRQSASGEISAQKTDFNAMAFFTIDRLHARSSFILDPIIAGRDCVSIADQLPIKRGENGRAPAEKQRAGRGSHSAGSHDR